MTDNIIIAVLASALTCFVIAYSITLGKLISSRKTSSKLFVDNFALQEFIKLLEDTKSTKSDQKIHEENFLKFLSDSRDWAFNYIEEVQSALSKFATDVEPEINYFKEYGDVMGMKPNYYSMKKISECYDELIKLLPKEEEEPK